MTVQSEVSRVSYSGDGSTTEFSVPFYFLANADLTVIVRAADGTETVQSLGTDYSVTGAGDTSGGAVTFTTAPASGTTIAILREPAITQLTNYNDQDPFPADSNERALDKLTMISQRLEEGLARTPKYEKSSSVQNASLPDPEGGKVLVGKNDGTGYVNADPGDAGLPGANSVGTEALQNKAVTTEKLDDDAVTEPKLDAALALTRAPVVYSRTAMKALDTARYNAANLIDAKRSGPFRLLAVSSLGEYDLLVRSADTTEGIFVNSTHDTAYTWVRAEWLVHKNIRDPMWFGAIGEAYFRGDGGITNPGLDEVWYSDPSFLVPAVSDSAAIQAAVDSIPTRFADGVTLLPHHRAGHTLQFKSGGYRLTSVITVGVRAMVVRGNGVAASDGTILIQTTGNANHFDGSYIYGFYGLVFQGLGNGVGTGNALNLAYSGTSLYSARLRDLYFVQLGNACIKLGTAGAQEPHIQGCTLEVTPYGLYAEEVKEALIGGNNFYGLSKAGVFIKKSEQNTLTGNNFELCAHGIGSGQTGFGAVVINATEPGTALARDTVISSNTFYSNNIDVALVGAVGTPSANTGPMGFTIIGNRSQFANAQSIYVNGPACVFILGHKVFDANNSNYANIAAIDINNSIDSHVDHCENWTPAANKVHWGLRSSANTNLRLGMSNRFTGQTADTSISSWSNLDFDRLPVITTANRPGASAARSGTAYIEDTGGTPRIVIHIGAARWYVALTASF